MTGDCLLRVSSKYAYMLGAFWKPTLTVVFVLGFGTWARASDPMLNLSANQLKFGAQVQGTASPSQVVVLTGIGEADVAISSITIGGQNSTEFTQTNACPIAPRVLAAGTKCEIHVVFQPRTSGGLSATLSINDNASGSPQSVSLNGHSTAPAPVVSLSPTSLSFDNQPVGTSSAVRVVGLTNGGSTTMNINSAIRVEGLSSDEFRLWKIDNGCPNDTGQLAPKASCKIGIIFKPTTLGARSAEVIIEDDAPGSPHAFALSGTGIAARNIP